MLLLGGNSVEVGCDEGGGGDEEEENGSRAEEVERRATQPWCFIFVS